MNCSLICNFPPHSPYLSHRDYSGFPKLKERLGERRFGSDNKIIFKENTWFYNLDKKYSPEGIQTLGKRGTKCVDLTEDYVKK